MVIKHELQENSRAIQNIITAIIETNIKDYEEYLMPTMKPTFFRYSKGRLLANRYYQVILKERFVEIVVKMKAIEYKGIICKIEELQKRIGEEVYSLTGYKVNYIHVKLV